MQMKECQNDCSLNWEIYGKRVAILNWYLTQKKGGKWGETQNWSCENLIKLLSDKILLHKKELAIVSGTFFT